MKQILRTKPAITWLITFVCFLLVSQRTHAAAKPLPVYPGFWNLTDEETPPKNKTAKTFARLNNDAVKIYPDPITRSMHVVAKHKDKKVTDFFVFDLEGSLLQHLKMEPREREKISGLKRGIYIYRVFAGDEETAAGKFEIR